MKSKHDLQLAAARCWERAGFCENAAERFAKAGAWLDAGRCFSQTQRHFDAALAYSLASEPVLEARQYLLGHRPERASSLYERLRLAPSLPPSEDVEVLLGLGEVEESFRVALGSGGHKAVAMLARLTATRGRPGLATVLWSQTDPSSWKSFTPWNRSLRWQLPSPVGEAARFWPSIEFNKVSMIPIWEENVGESSWGDRALDWSTDSTFFAAALRNGGIARGQIGPEGSRLKRLQLSNEAYCVGFLPASHAVLAGLASGEVSLVDELGSVQSMESLRMPNGVWNIGFAPATNRVAISCKKSPGALLKIRAWQTGEHGTQLKELREPSEITCWPIAAWSPDGLQHCWSPGPFHQRNQIFFLDQPPVVAHAEVITSLAFTSNGRFLVTASWDKTVTIRDGVTGQSLAPPERFSNSVYGARVHPQAALVAVGEGNRLHLLRLQDGEALQLSRLSEQTLDNHVYSLAFSPDGRHLLVMTKRHLHLFRVDLKP